MPELPTWLTAVISSVIAAAISFFAGRRLYAATIEEKTASTSKIWAAVAEDAVKQLKEVRSEIPGWMQKLAAETARADVAEKQLGDKHIIREQAAIIIEAAAELSYMKDPDEPESKVERQFKRMKEAAAKIAALKE